MINFIIGFVIGFMVAWFMSLIAWFWVDHNEVKPR